MSRWELKGVLNLSTVPDIWQDLAAKIHRSKQLTVSLAGVKSASSAALALLLQGLDEARDAGCELHYEQIPADLRALTQVSNVQEILGA
ncbi:STAS domain-containing protein [Thiolapillus sp.]|uniref:STAS domain-containing protein n=1 Tax=Thiolapillus sp. TaxID=2017437 RepID=UPI003AF9272F